jgi:hypothetical protein
VLGFFVFVIVEAEGPSNVFDIPAPVWILIAAIIWIPRPHTQVHLHGVPAMLSFPPPKFTIGQRTGLPSRRWKESNLVLALIAGRGRVRPNPDVFGKRRREREDN